MRYFIFDLIRETYTYTHDRWTGILFTRCLRCVSQRDLLSLRGRAHPLSCSSQTTYLPLRNICSKSKDDTGSVTRKGSQSNVKDRREHERDANSISLVASFLDYFQISYTRVSFRFGKSIGSLNTDWLFIVAHGLFPSSSLGFVFLISLSLSRDRIITSNIIDELSKIVTIMNNIRH